MCSCRTPRQCAIGVLRASTTKRPPPRIVTKVKRLVDSMIGQIGALSGRSASDSHGCPLGVVQVARLRSAAGSCDESVGRVVGADPLDQLAVLVRHYHVGAVGRRHGHVRLAGTAGPGSRPEAGHRLPGGAVHEQHVPGGHEGDDGVGLRGFMAIMCGRTGFAPVLARHSAAAAPPRSIFLRRCRCAVPVLEVVPVPDVERAAECRAWGIRLVDGPDSVRALAAGVSRARQSAREQQRNPQNGLACDLL